MPALRGMNASKAELAEFQTGSIPESLPWLNAKSRPALAVTPWFANTLFCSLSCTRGHAIVNPVSARSLILPFFPMIRSTKKHRPHKSGVEVAQSDQDLFRGAVGRVRPLPGSGDAGPDTPKPKPEPLQFERDERAVRAELMTGEFDPGSIEQGDEIHYLKIGQAADILKRLRRGQYSIRAEIDLHQMTVTVARKAVTLFLNDAIKHRELCVRIVHGKGLRSASRGPVLKRMTERLLRQRNDVIAFSSALPAQGGTGAVLVLLQEH